MPRARKQITKPQGVIRFS